MVAVFSPELDLEPVDGVALLAELGELAGGLGLELLDAHFEAPRRHGEFGAQLILVGLDFRHRQRGRGFEPAHGQPHRAAMDEGNDDEPDQGRDEKADPEIHDRFDHERRLQLTRSAETMTRWRAHQRNPGLASRRPLILYINKSGGASERVPGRPSA